MARMIFLGTGAALPCADRTNTTIAVLPDSATPGLLIDCGGDVYGALLRAHIAPDAIGDLLITHAHIDHIGSLPSLIESYRLGGRTSPLRIWALPEVLSVAQRLIAVYDYELKLHEWTYDINFSPVEHGQQLILGSIPARILAMDHSLPSVGIRVELPGGAIAYTSDTQPTPTVAELAKGASMLITECTFLHTDVQHARSSKHTTALEAGHEAATSGVATLALVHIGVGDAIDAARAEAAQSFSGEILIPNDGDTTDL
ncbi:MAG: MBL fold metallo-hydrolase [Ktedonobacterales bacterium]